MGHLNSDLAPRINASRVLDGRVSAEGKGTQLGTHYSS